MSVLSLDRLGAVRTPGTGLAILGVVGGGVLGALSAYRLAYGALAVVLTLLGLATIRRPANLAILALVGVFAVQRLGSASGAPGSSGGISVSDVLLAAATVLAIPAVFGSPEFARLRPALLGVGAYLSLLLPSLFLHPSSRAYFEWAHRLVLVGGSLLVGAWIAREGLTRLALRWLTFVACLMAAAAVESSISTGFEPATPLDLHKNFVGALLAAMLVLVAVAPDHLALGPRRQTLALVLLAAGLVASQSRGAMLGAVAGLLVAFLLDPRGHNRGVRALSFLVALVLGGVAYFSIRDQLNQTQAEAKNGSIGVRFNVERVTQDIWRTSPITGVGLKYYNSGEFGRFALAANNDVDNELAESGVVGLLGFIALQGFAIGAGVRRRRSGKLIAAATGIAIAQLLHGMFDIYWSAGVVSLPFLLLGMALANSPEAAAAAPTFPRHATTRGRQLNIGTGVTSGAGVRNAETYEIRSA